MSQIEVENKKNYQAMFRKFIEEERFIRANPNPMETLKERLIINTKIKPEELSTLLVIYIKNISTCVWLTLNKEKKILKALVVLRSCN